MAEKIYYDLGRYIIGPVAGLIAAVLLFNIFFN